MRPSPTLYFRPEIVYENILVIFFTDRLQFEVLYKDCRCRLGKVVYLDLLIRKATKPRIRLDKAQGARVKESKEQTPMHSIEIVFLAFSTPRIQNVVL